MRIKRFNENQQYLTDPLDPDTETTFEIDFTKHIEEVSKSMELLSKELGLIYKQRGSITPSYYFEDKSGLTRTYLWTARDNKFLHSLKLYDGQGDAGDYSTIGKIKEDLIEYFDLK